MRAGAPFRARARVRTSAGPLPALGVVLRRAEPATGGLLARYAFPPEPRQSRSLRPAGPPATINQMSKKSAVQREAPALSDNEVLAAFKEGMASWASAIESHKMAPPDAGFAARLDTLAHGASEAARVCREADLAGFEWPPARKADSEPPYELRPDTGRRGPEALWRRFDRAVVRLRAAASGTDMLEVARAYDEIAAVGRELSEAVADEDRANVRPRTRARRSA